MHILQLYSGQNIHTGDFIYRIKLPAIGLSALDGIVVQNLDLLEVNDKSTLIKATLLILHHLTDPDLLPVVTERRRLQIPTVYELADNFLASQAHKNGNQFINIPDYSSIIEELLRRCDAVQCTNKALQKRFQHLNKNFYIFQNIIEPVKTPANKHKSKKGLILGWGGSARHYCDLAYYSSAIMTWVRKHPDVKLAIMGSNKIRTLFKSLSKEQLLFIEPGSLDNYFSFLSTLDIGIAPLCPNEFNVCRSDIKYLEYASREVTPLCSRFGPYLEIGGHDDRIMLFENGAELVQKLEFLRTNPEKRRQIAHAAKNWVEKHRSNHLDHWKIQAQTYRQLLHNKDTKFTRDHFTSHTGSSTKIGQMLIQGINASNIQKGLNLMKKAVELNPNNYQAYYFYGWALTKIGNYPKAIRVLKTALELRPDSVRSAQLLTQAYILSHDIKSALVTINNALRIEPKLTTLLKLKATILQLKMLQREVPNLSPAEI